MVMFEEILGINRTDVTVYMHGTYNTMELDLEWLCRFHVVQAAFP